MFKNIRNNPILSHLMRHAGWPSLQTALFIAAALTVIGLALTSSAYALYPGGGTLSFSSHTVLTVELLLLVFGPLITAVVVVVSTVRAIDTKAYQMMRLSELSERDIVSGYAAGALFRLRSLWITAGGLVFPLIMALIHLGVVVTIVFACIVDPMKVDPNCIPPEPSEIVMRQVGIALILTLCYVAVFIAWNYLAAGLGVWMAFQHRQTGKALVVTLLLLVFVMAFQIVGSVQSHIDFGMSWRLPVIILLFAGIDIGWGLWAVSDLAVRHVRETTE
jgi:hypothetical protein